MVRRKTGSASSDYYDILQVLPCAEQEVIQGAFRALMGRYHPDKSAGDGELAKRLNEAYATLGDPDKRSAYDASREKLDGTVIGEYRILKFIAEGGIGKTYKGEHILTGMPVCIKHCSRISPVFKAVLIEEAQAMWDLRHFSIPAVRSVLELQDGSIALVMSYIPGPTLAQVVEKVKGLESEHVAWIAERVLNALKYMHHHGVVHGDLKPQNVIVQPENHTVVVVDFGLAMVKPTKDSTSKGFTDHFAPPEQMRGAPLVPESDFYSLGMTMIYALSGDIGALVRREVPEKTPAPLCRFIKRLIVQDVLNRPRWDAEDLADTLEEVRKESFGRRHSAMKPIPGV